MSQQIIVKTFQVFLFIILHTLQKSSVIELENFGLCYLWGFILAISVFFVVFLL